MSLFIDQPLDFDKTAALARLTGNSQDWSPRVVSELHKHVPFIHAYQSTLNWSEMNPEQGYALGYIDVRNKTVQSASEEIATGGVKHCRIPVVIRKFELQPFDVFMKGEKVYPLTEERLTEKMFRPDTFDAARKVPADAPLTAHTTAPKTTRGGLGSEGITHTASPRFLMDAIGDTLTRTDMDRFAEKIASDESLQVAIRANPAFSSVLGMVKFAAELPQDSGPELIEHMRRGLKPTVVQLTKLANGNVLFKWANPAAFDPQQQQVPADEAAEVAGPELAAMPPQSTMTMGPSAESQEMLLQEEPEPVATFGEYKVTRLSDGKEIMGWVIPNLVKFSLEPTELAAFTNGSEYDVKPGMVGKMVGRGANLPAGDPRGYGIFYFEKAGKVVGTVPITIGSTVKMPDGTTALEASDDLGQPIKLSIVTGIANVAQVGEGEYAVPDSWAFLPLDGRVDLVTMDPPPEAPAGPEPGADQPPQPEMAGPAVPPPAGGAPQAPMSPAGGPPPAAAGGAPQPTPGAQAPVMPAAMPPSQAMNKMAAARQVGNTCTIRADRHTGTYSLDGRAFEKVASSMIDHPAAEFLLVASGVTPMTARTKLAEAAKSVGGQSYLIADMKPITPWKEKVASAYRDSAVLMQSLPKLKRDLVKEAVAIDDADTVDKMLALGFLTPENVKIFLSYIPALQAATSKLADLLLAVRLGLQGPPESATRTAMFTIEEVVRGLRRLES
jgi:hypothetical protein